MKLKGYLFKGKRQKNYIEKTQGAAAVEFSLVFPLFFLTFMGVFELGAIMFVQTTLERAILNVSRFGRTGNTVTGQTRQQTSQSLISAATFGYLFMDPAKIKLTITPYASFAAIPPYSTAPNTGQQNFGASKQPVLYTLSYPWTFWTPLVGTYLSPSGNTINLTASSIIQNEPY